MSCGSHSPQLYRTLPDTYDEREQGAVTRYEAYWESHPMGLTLVRDKSLIRYVRGGTNIYLSIHRNRKGTYSVYRPSRCSQRGIVAVALWCKYDTKTPRYRSIALLEDRR